MNQSDQPNFSLSRDDFPKGFRFGVSTSSYQIEGSNFGGCGPSHWDSFAAETGNIADNSSGDIACDHFNRWSEDLDLIRDCAMGSYRFSFSWPRILPTGSGQINQQGLDFYDKLIDGILERDIEPWACLYHWDLPQGLAEKGGWQNRDTAMRFADYAQIIAEKFGSRLHALATFNEPWCSVWLGHYAGVHAPGLKDLHATGHALHHHMLAHGEAISRLRDCGVDNLGIILNFEHLTAASASPEDQYATQINDDMINRWFMQAIFKKSYPANTLKHLEPYLPQGFANDFNTIAAPLDWLGVNYYSSYCIADNGSGKFPFYTHAPSNLPKTEMGWPINATGLEEIILWTQQEYSHGLPIFVTENGMATLSDKFAIADHPRIDFIDQHMHAIRNAINKGADVRGYLIWSLLDNFEWAHGYGPRFGMVHVDYETLERTPKLSWKALQKILS